MTLEPHRSCKNTCIVKGGRRNRLVLRSLSPRTSSITFSTSAVAHGKTMESRSFFTTQDTLSMISTPWTTDSSSTQSCFRKSRATSKPTSSKRNRESLGSVLPKSTSTSGISSPGLTSQTLTTITLYNVKSIATLHSTTHIPPPNKHRDSMETLSSWTIESFTSDGTSSLTGIVRPAYPWSPSTDVFSDRLSDFYPTSEDTFVSRKGSQVSPRMMESAAPYDIAPMNYTKNKLSEESFFLDWLHMKANGVPIVK